jgi:uncharacterized integral membrane protein
LIIYFFRSPKLVDLFYLLPISNSGGELLQGYHLVMYGLLNLVLVFLLTACSVLFALSNQGEVDVSFPGGLVFPDVPLFVLAFVPMFLGFFLGAISGLSRKFRYRKRLDGLQRKNQALAEELTNLRNLPLDNDTQL